MPLKISLATNPVVWADSATCWFKGLFDFIGKDEPLFVHSRVINVFLQILDAGRVTCGLGRTFDLSGFYVILSSNLGAADILRAKHLNFTQIEKHILGQVATAFRPEFLGRIDSKLVYRKLSSEVQVEIAQMNLDRERKFLAERGHDIEFEEDVLTFLLQVGFDKYLGARPLNKAMEKYIRAPLARYQIAHAQDGLSGKLRVGCCKNQAYFRFLAHKSCNLLIH